MSRRVTGTNEQGLLSFSHEGNTTQTGQNNIKNNNGDVTISNGMDWKVGTIIAVVFALFGWKK